MEAASDTIDELRAELAACKAELADVLKKLNRKERKLTKANKYNAELANELDELKSKIHEQRRKKEPSRRDKEVQTDMLVQIDRLMESKECSHDANNTQNHEVISYEPIKVEQTEGGETQSIADILRATAEQAISQSDYVYDDNTGLYYDQVSGYYYDPANRLFFDSSTYTYYSYNETTGQHEFHSQADMSQYENYYKHQMQKQEKLERRAQRRVRQAEKQARLEKREDRKREKDQHDEVQVGLEKLTADFTRQLQIECQRRQDEHRHNNKRMASCVVKNKDIEANQCHNVQDDNSEAEEGEVVSSDEESSSHSSDAGPEVIWRPPCVRVIVKESSNLELGTLYVITIAGGTIGQSENCDIRLHADEAGEDDTPSTIRLSHRDELQINSTVLLIHIHSGTETCDGCEPGKIINRLQSQQISFTKTKSDLEKDRRSQLKAIKERYGLEAEKYKETRVNLGSQYEDKAEIRRKTLGIDDHFTADQGPSSVNIPISDKNLGHKLLQKMGWKDGESLGKSQDGVLEPVQVGVRLNINAGLGSLSNQTVSMDEGGNLPQSRRKAEIILKTQKRFEQAKTSTIFNQAEEDSEKL